jgi:hypothetical protein
MIYYNDHFFERFDVLFGKKSSIVAGKEYPLGYFAAEAMDMDDALLTELKKLTQQASQEFDMFLTARTVPGAGMAIQALDRAWELVRQLPLYSKIPYREGRGSSVSGIVRELCSDEQKLDRMLTVGMTENELLRRWRGMYDRLADDLQRFRYDTDDMLTDYFEELPSRRPEAYAAAFESCMASFCEIYMQTEDDDELAYMNKRRLNFPVSISFVVERGKKTGQRFMAERMTFEDLISFLYMDLYRGMAAGNVPRLCHNCGKWFLAIGAYDTVYCQRVAPGETTRTCRQVGAHIKEREKNGKDFAYREYYRVYNRLKTWKQRGKISAEEWNRRVAYIQEVKTEFLAGDISDVAYIAKLDQV